MPFTNKTDAVSGPNPAQVAALCRGNGTPVDEKTADGLCAYIQLLVKWNRRCNLVGPYDWEKILLELVLDSWHLAAFLKNLALPPAPVSLDLGAGAGLPGIPLRLLWGDGAYRMVELREKRTIFLETVLARLPLPDTRVLRMDAREALAAHAPVDVVLSRAFLPWAKVLELARPFLGTNGHVLIMSNDPLPADVGPSWQTVADARYRAAGKDRSLRALRPAL